MAELIELNRHAEADAKTARAALSEGAYQDAGGVDYNRNGPEATAWAMLAIENRLAMLALFVIAAMEDDDDDPPRKPRI